MPAGVVNNKMVINTYLKMSVYLLMFCIYALFAGAESPFDYNHDGIIRCAVISGISTGDGLDTALLCSDLEGMIKEDNPGQPVRVSLEMIGNSKTILGWWYHPDSRPARLKLKDAAYDFIFLAERQSMAVRYPELFFEGVYTTVNHFSRRRTKIMLLMTESPPAESYRDKSILNLADITYRVADGCGIGVVPAAFAWHDVMRHNILTGNSLLKKRACSFLAAASIWCQITDEKVPKRSLSTDWVVKKTASKMAKSASDAVAESIKKKHYRGPFEGVVHCDTRMQQLYLSYHSGIVDNDGLRPRLNNIFNDAGQDVFQRSTADWYDSGFDRHSAAFDLVYGSLDEMNLFLDDRKYTSTEYISENIPSVCRVVYNRNPVHASNKDLTLRSLENLLIEGYDFARNNNCTFIPYQIAWARSFAANPEKSDNERTMLANMIYTALSGSFQMPSRKDDFDYAKTGWLCMRQLSALNSRQNCVLVRRDKKLVDASTSAALNIRLLESPSAPVYVLCAPDKPSMLALSRKKLEFTSANYSIEQLVNCVSRGKGTNVFCNVLVRAESNDPDIDGSFTKRSFLLNKSEKTKSGFVFEKTELALEDQSYLMLKPEIAPVDIVLMKIFQNNIETASIIFSPSYHRSHPVCLFPDAADLKKGECRVLLKAESSDSRFNKYQREFVIKIDATGLKIPAIKIISPRKEEQVAGPSFFLAEATVADVEQPLELSLFCGNKRLGLIKGSRLQSPVEMGPPQSRLKAGEYPVWAAARLKNGLVVASDVHSLTVK